MAIGMPSPLIPVQVLYVNLITSVTCGIVLALERPEPDTMQRPPRSPKKQLLGKLLQWRCIFVSTIIIVAMLGNMQWELSRGSSLRAGRAVAMNTLVACQALYLFNCKYIRRTSLGLDALVSNAWLPACALLNAALQGLLTYTPPIAVRDASRGCRHFACVFATAQSAASRGVVAADCPAVGAVPVCIHGSLSQCGRDEALDTPPAANDCHWLPCPAVSSPHPHRRTYLAWTSLTA
jgi:magnesium-transporting ATPase (P-type)